MVTYVMNTETPKSHQKETLIWLTLQNEVQQKAQQVERVGSQSSFPACIGKTVSSRLKFHPIAEEPALVHNSTDWFNDFDSMWIKCETIVFSRMVLLCWSWSISIFKSYPMWILSLLTWIRILPPPPPQNIHEWILVHLLLPYACLPCIGSTRDYASNTMANFSMIDDSIFDTSHKPQDPFVNDV